ncbi:LysR substrate-binding domain-containing protein [Bradyrhizobium sp. LHD-71]|uniref:LysR family transcriptional regulator n=1 Tax=Bradyrhizobium sp. LHD-71 TaxID=3072141 RepID=UPI00280F5F2A|nr:LysR substrate-binding domain-containing protein [Bradyrhizobium sp. LHD-71]MDQ8732357.1 LysR substrate-binding domain-containing protein [Bradyrhizobium sp. LHD-71]
MELRHIRYFVALAEELHFGRAAARLGISQPPLSQQIKILEETLCARLLNRTNRHVELTQAGQLFLPEARAILERTERAMSVAMRAERGELGELRIAMFPSAPLLARIGDAILAFRKSYPDVQLILNEFESHQQTQGVLEGRVQIAIIRSAVAPVVPPTVRATELFREPFFVIMRLDHPLAKRRKICIGELARESFVFYGDRMGRTLPHQVLHLCRSAGFEPRIGQLANGNATITGLVAAGLGIAVVPEAMCQLQHKVIVSRPLDAADATTSTWLLRRGHDNSPLVNAFCRLVARRSA